MVEERINIEVARSWYESYRRRYPEKGIEAAKRATLKYIIGLHRFWIDEEPPEEVVQEYKRQMDGWE
ncbi:MAG: hypothetical protein DRN40_04125 [Thermoplasmata archaeon]|nr:MAG: hypothetical protein DRN40_04125 [Thermoplasmata archaeon]